MYACIIIDSWGNVFELVTNRQFIMEALLKLVVKIRPQLKNIIIITPVIPQGLGRGLPNSTPTIEAGRPATGHNFLNSSNFVVLVVASVSADNEVLGLIPWSGKIIGMGFVQ